MRIYVGHSRSFDYKKELYEPLRKSHLNSEHKIVLPHEKSDEPFDSKNFLKSCDVMIADVSYPSTGLGIELGWANSYKVLIICVYRKGSKISYSLKAITSHFFEYSNEKELISGIEKVLEEL